MTSQVNTKGRSMKKEALIFIVIAIIAVYLAAAIGFSQL